MLAYMNDEALAKTQEDRQGSLLVQIAEIRYGLRGSPQATFSLSREIRVDCDEDAILL